MIVGEFGPIEFGDNPNSGKINWEYLIEYAAEKEIGWLAWVWNWEDHHSIVNRSTGKYNDWANAPWGEQVAVASPYSIQNTSIRPNWLETGIHTSNKIPSKSSLYQNYPNPFNSSTTIKYENLEESMVRLVISNVQGEKIKILVSENQNVGEYSIQWDAVDEHGLAVPSGMYFILIWTDHFHQIQKMLLLR